MRSYCKSVWVKAIFVLFAAAAIGFGSTIASAAETYKIGCIFPMTGTVASSGEYLRNGALLAVDQVNAAGGIDGHMLELVVEDSKSMPRDGIMAFNKLVDVDNVMVVLPTLSAIVMAMIPEVNARDVVLVNTLAKTDDLVGSGPRIFSITVPSSADGKAQARFAFEDLGAKTAVMLYLKSDVGVSYDNVISAEFERLGGKIISREGHDAGATDYRAVLTKVKQMNPDVIFIESLYQETASIIKQARELGITTPTVGYSTVMSGQFSEIAGSAANGHVVCVSGFDSEDPAPYVQDFLKAFEERFKTPAVIDSAMAYDAVLMIAEAIKIGGYSADGITEGLKQLPGFKGGTGITEPFNEQLVVDRPITMKYYQDGNWLTYGK